MIAILIVIHTLFQPQAVVDTLNQVIILQDSLLEQDQEVLNLSSLDGWEFTADDIQDSTVAVNWFKIKSDSEDIMDSLWKGFGWYRLTFKVDSSLSLKDPFLQFASKTNVAAEIYLNNELVLKIGNPSRNLDEEEVVANYVEVGKPIILSPNTEYVLTIKRSYHSFPIYNILTFGSSSKPYWFSIRIVSINAVNFDLTITKTNTMLFTIVCVVIFLLFILYLILYFRIKDQKENLWLLLLMICIGFVSFYNLILLFSFPQFWLNLFINSAVLIFASTALTFTPLITYKLLKIHAHPLWKYYAVIGGVIYIFSSSIGIFNYTFIIVLTLSIVGGLSAIYSAYKKGIRNTLIPAISILGLPATLIILQTAEYLGINISDPASGLSIIYGLFLFLSLPVGLSLFQGKKFLRLHLEMDDLVEERTIELEQAYKQLEHSLETLKSTQAQLIQSEKMASLGELTAGIAHEIQNPLNFVNNFSEVSNELMEEVSEERSKSPETRDENLVSEILEDIKENLSNITLHGKRADAIVKGMLEHSRSSSGEKVLTDINALAEEYLRLSYHGMRAKDKSFSAESKTDFDPSLPKINVVPPEIGRVILNLINNAFYAVNEKAKEGIEGYVPEIYVSSNKTEKGITLTIRDNGPGIPDPILDKIFQPFFTTKPTGSGTGLGLSLSYDIIKAHGGEIKVTTEEGAGSKFIIQLFKQLS